MGWTVIDVVRPIAGTGQNITIGASSVQSTALGIASNAQVVLLSAIGGNCHIALGTNPTATATDMLIKASDPPIGIRIGTGEKIAVIQDQSSTGTLNIIEATH
jgi:hypothetical protein